MVKETERQREGMKQKSSEEDGGGGGVFGPSLLKCITIQSSVLVYLECEAHVIAATVN